MDKTEATTGSKPLIEDWAHVDWRTLERRVYRLQKRIYRAQRRGNTKAVHSLQRLLMKSWAARMLAVRRVTQDNQGKRTAGIDGIKHVEPKDRVVMATTLADTSHIKARPIRRVMIPKRNKNEMRPLGIPVMLDRAHQALVKLALEPQWEARFEPNSYGFRPGRSPHDAIEAIFKMLREQPKYALDADIQGCFDHISHTALLAKIDAPAVIRRAIKAWLKAGVMVDLTLTPTEMGTPQGGVISPLLANVALHGLEDAVAASYMARRYYDRSSGGRTSLCFRPRVVRFADDFIVLFHDLAGIEAAKATVEQFLATMGLRLSPEKTRITHTLIPHEGQVGLDFLGFHIQQYPAGQTHGRNANGKPLGFKTLIYPSKESVNRHLADLRALIHAHRSSKQEVLIYALGPVIKGWTRYFRTACSSRAFNHCEFVTYRMLRRWAERRHKKSKHWVSRRYWRASDNKWRFGDDRVYLWKHYDTHIQRHVKVRGTASPFDGNLLYWARRLKNHPLSRTVETKLLNLQSHKCVWCGLYFREGDLLEVDHIDPRGGERVANKQLLHRHCHDQKTTHCGNTRGSGRRHQ